MKIFYSIFLSIIFIFHNDVEAGPNTLAQYRTPIYDTSDSSLSFLKDSLFTTPAAPENISKKFVSGTASFYNKSFEGLKTATGETFRNAAFTAACNQFPLDTWLRVTNLRNGKSVVVRVNDRMHKKMSKKGRIIDLTSAAAKKIGLTLRIGLAKVKIEAIEDETDN